MKKLFYLFAVIFLLSACRERNENLIDLSEKIIPGEQLVIDTSFINTNAPAPSPKNVLVEDYSGIRCVNCPIASETAYNIGKANPGRVAVIGIYPNAMPSLTRPYVPGNKYDFRSVEGTNLLNMLGTSQSLPIGSVDRKQFSGEEKALVDHNKWGPYTNTQLNINGLANISFSKTSFNESERLLEVTIEVIYTQAVSEPNYISLAVTEDGLVDLQYTPTGIDSNYVHNHVLRRFAQPTSGLQLGQSFERGRNFIVKYRTILPDDWNAEKCNLVAILHYRGAASNEVLQVKEEKVKK